MVRVFLILFGFAVVTSCANRSLAYLDDIEEESYTVGVPSKSVLPVIKPGDILDVTISSISARGDSLFRRGTRDQGNQGYYSADGPIGAGYLVDEEGYIDYPILGRIKLAGLTKKQVKEKFLQELEGELIDPIVNVRYLNFTVTVTGEVNNPDTFFVPSEQINVIQALGLAGDMTVYGKRQNVMVMREDGGLMTTTRLNLNKKEVLESPYFYLKPNDIIYVEPDRIKKTQASSNTMVLSIITSALTIGVVLLTTQLN
ncbi:MAG: polysaccharide biosynthesis/export family protein [Leeuwenhoekiella sp.]